VKMAAEDVVRSAPPDGCFLEWAWAVSAGAAASAAEAAVLEASAVWAVSVPAEAVPAEDGKSKSLAYSRIKALNFTYRYHRLERWYRSMVLLKIFFNTAA